MINYNGSLFDDSERILTSQNRAFRYGDGIFETIRIVDGKMPFFPYHFERILRGVKALRMNVPSYLNIHYMRNEISKVIETLESGRVRLAIWREEGGYYTTYNHNIDFLIEASPLLDKSYQLNELGLTIGLYKDFRLRQTPISAYKTSNSLPYVLAGIFAKENSFDDVIILDTEGYVAEGIASNIFIFYNDTLITPALTHGCVGGIMRSIVLEIAKEIALNVQETAIRPELLLEADEIFYTNVIQGIRWVDSLQYKTYHNELSTRLYHRLLLRLS